ncbi:hypothetical protein Q6334_28835, partial [Klebsiella pneumoniae]|uniref:hypothetical protein n=1 Tax=Klebsiella pneumoniae TaxID=573 RepID=UPI002730E5F6
YRRALQAARVVNQLLIIRQKCHSITTALPSRSTSATSGKISGEQYPGKQAAHQKGAAFFESRINTSVRDAPRAAPAFAGAD